MTEWHVLRPPVKNEDLDENGFFRRGSLTRSTSADRKGAAHSNTLPKKGSKRMSSSESFQKEWNKEWNKGME